MAAAVANLNSFTAEVLAAAQEGESATRVLSVLDRIVAAAQVRP